MGLSLKREKMVDMSLHVSVFVSVFIKCTSLRFVQLSDIVGYSL